MRILFLEPIGNLWGSEQSLIESLQAGVNAGAKIGVFCPPNSPICDVLSNLSVATFPYFERDLHKKGTLRRLVSVSRLLKCAIRFRPDVVHANQAGALRYAQVVGRVLKIPITTHVRFHEDVHYVESVFCRHPEINKVFCISDYIKGLFSSGGVSTQGRLRTIYNPYIPKTDWNCFHKVESCPTFTCVARLEPNKRHDLLLKAVALLKARRILSKLVFYGEARYGDNIGDRLKKMASELQIESQVTWAGFERNVVSKIGGATAQVCPFEKEGLGRVVLEAWDAGVIPVAWSGSGGPAELIAQSEAGVLYSEQSPESLSAALEAAISLCNEQRVQMITKGRLWLKSNCSPDSYFQSALSIWSSAKKYNDN